MELSRPLTTISENTIWNSIWNLVVPPKVKNLIWRALSNCLPTLAALYQRHVQVNVSCPFCSSNIEDAYHVFVACYVAKSVWRMSNVGDLSSLFVSFFEFCNFIIRNKNKEDINMAAMLCWTLWNNRNLKVWKDSCSSTLVLFNNATTFFKEWNQAQSLWTNCKASNTSVQERWTPPTEGRINCNIDAAIFPNSNNAGYGLVIHDSAGFMLAAKNGALNYTQDPLIAEALSCREALSWLKDKGYRDVLLESDSQLLVYAMQSQEESDSMVGLIISDCKFLVKKLGNCSVSFGRRSANQVVHVLARAVDSMSGHEWGVVPPHFLIDVLEYDA